MRIEPLACGRIAVRANLHCRAARLMVNEIPALPALSPVRRLLGGSVFLFIEQLPLPGRFLLWKSFPRLVPEFMDFELAHAKGTYRTAARFSRLGWRHGNLPHGWGPEEPMSSIPTYRFTCSPSPSDFTSRSLVLSIVPELNGVQTWKLVASSPYAIIMAASQRKRQVHVPVKEQP